MPGDSVNLRVKLIITGGAWKQAAALPFAKADLTVGAGVITEIIE